MSNEVLNSLLREYDQKKLKAELDLDERKKNLYKLIPRLEKIDEELNSFAFKTAKSILNNSTLSDNTNNCYTVENLKQKIDTLKKEYLNVLSSNYLYNEIEKDINDVSIESVDVYAEESVINNFKNKFKNVIVEKINEKY